MNIQKTSSKVRRLPVLSIFALVLGVGVFPDLQAEIYQCINDQGNQSFSSKPCKNAINPGASIAAISPLDTVANGSLVTFLTTDKKSIASRDKAKLFAVDAQIKDLEKHIDKLQRERARAIAAVDVPESTHDSVYRQQTEIRSRFDSRIASNLVTISQLRESRQALMQKVM